MSQLRSPRFSHPCEVPEADLTGALEGDDGQAHLHEFSDWSSLADDEFYRVELRQRLRRLRLFR